MYPEKRAFTASGNATSETAIDRSVWRDLYLSLGDEVPGGGWTVRVYHKPLVNWIWGGALLMAIGGGFAVTDRRYALASKKVHKTIDVKDKDNIVAAVSPAASTD
jgi:cytochrome c-type biogenesis protein CcmF